MWWPNHSYEFPKSYLSNTYTPEKQYMTMEKQPWMKMYLLFETGYFFHCHVSFQGGNVILRLSKSMFLCSKTRPLGKKNWSWKTQPPSFWNSGLVWLVVSTQLKNISQNGNLPQTGVKIQNIWNHHSNFVVVWSHPKNKATSYISLLM